CLGDVGRVADGLDLGDDVVGRQVVGHGHARLLGGVVDAGLHAVHAVEPLADAGRARGAGHAADLEVDGAPTDVIGRRRAHGRSSYPASSTAAAIAAASTAPSAVTVTAPAPRSTTTAVTPGSLVTSPVTAWTQCSQLMPVTEKVSIAMPVP